MSGKLRRVGEMMGSSLAFMVRIALGTVVAVAVALAMGVPI